MIVGGNVDAETIYTILTIVGSFVTTGLAINAFFLRGIFEDLNSVKVTIATALANDKAKQKEIDELKLNQKILFEVQNNLRERVHYLEGGQKQVLEFIKENK